MKNTTKEYLQSAINLMLSMGALPAVIAYVVIAWGAMSVSAAACVATAVPGGSVSESDTVTSAPNVGVASFIGPIVTWIVTVCEFVPSDAVTVSVYS